MNVGMGGWGVGADGRRAPALCAVEEPAGPVRQERSYHADTQAVSKSYFFFYTRRGPGFKNCSTSTLPRRRLFIVCSSIAAPPGQDCRFPLDRLSGDTVMT